MKYRSNNLTIQSCWTNQNIENIKNLAAIVHGRKIFSPDACDDLKKKQASSG